MPALERRTSKRRPEGSLALLSDDTVGELSRNVRGLTMVMVRVEGKLDKVLERAERFLADARQLLESRLPPPKED